MTFTQSNPQHDLPRWGLTVEEAATVCNCSVATIRRAISRQHLNARKIGNRLRIEPAELDRWWQSLPETGPQQ